MPEAVIRSESYLEGYRLTTTNGGLQVETIRADPRPLRLDLAQLAHLGPRLADDHYIEVQPDQEATAIVDRVLGSLSRAIEVLQRQRDPAAYRWDIENLKRAWTVLGGLDEEGVQRIVELLQSQE